MRTPFASGFSSPRGCPASSTYFASVSEFVGPRTVTRGPARRSGTPEKSFSRLESGLPVWSSRLLLIHTTSRRFCAELHPAAFGSAPDLSSRREGLQLYHSNGTEKVVCEGDAGLGMRTTARPRVAGARGATSDATT